MHTLAVTTLELSRWQFGVTTIYHFIFVPLTIGMGWFVAGFQTAWYRTGDDRYLRLTHFFGKLFLINFALGVVTGIVQEFQFGMNWSNYSRYVGDVFGAPLAIEGLAAFFLESTFLGLWIFGWGRLAPKVHLAAIWAVAIGSLLSAYFILAANSWMQHPVGYRIANGRAEMTSVWAIFTNGILLQGFGHVIAACGVTAAALVLGVSAYHLLRGHEVDLFARAARPALAVSLVSGLLVIGFGHTQSQLLVKEQPMKMAAAEALYETEKPAPLSLFAIGAWKDNPERSTLNITVPHMLSFLTDWHWNSEVKGISDIQRESEAKYGSGNYRPIIAVTYWSFRVMVGAGFALAAFAVWGLWLMRRRRLERSSLYLKLAIAAIALPLIANTAGWMLTEMGRQPWVVWGLYKTSDAVSPSVGVWSVGLTLAGFTLLYGVLAAIETWLLVHVARRGPEPLAAAPSTEEGGKLPYMAY